MITVAQHAQLPSRMPGRNLNVLWDYIESEIILRGLGRYFLKNLSIVDIQY